MRSASIVDPRVEKNLGNRVADAMARKALFRILQRLPCGHLVLDDGGDVHSFGRRGDALHAHVFIHDASAYRAIVFGGSIGAGESYMAGSWSSPNLVDVIRLMARNMTLLQRLDNGRSPLRRGWHKLLHRLNANTLRGARDNIAAHYDLGNDFFALFLDSAMMYSAAMFPSADSSLEAASRHKLDSICRKLDLSPADHLMEIGTGWGGLAIHAARHYGCRVTTTTLSREQYDYAVEAVAEAGLSDRITLLLDDYRNLEGQFDKLVSVEMIEAVGHEYYATYFRQCSRLLKPDGVMLIQAITIPGQRYEQAKRNVDFIQRYIFPGGGLPSLEVIARCVSGTDLQLLDMQDIGLDYARTLSHWRQRFHDRLNQVRAMGFDAVFCRMWEFYLCYCEGGFLERSISTAQIVMAKPDARSTVARP